jgi:group I intron endonuclease
MAINKGLLKYGFSNFSLEILEYCEVENLIEREKYYFNLLKPEYNIALEPGSPSRGKG